MSLTHRFRLAALIAIAALTPIFGDVRSYGQELLPDIVPWVREDARFLVNWDLNNGRIRFETMFANIGDGLFQIRTDLAGTGGATTPLTQRVFRGVDNGPLFQDYPVASALNFHNTHGHIHFDDFSEFQLLQLVTQPSGIVTVGPLVAGTIKTSYNVSDTSRIPDPAWNSAVSYTSSSRGLFQNISVGFGDIYSHGTEGQNSSLAGVPPGQYWLRQIVDPSNLIREKSENNNSREILIDLSQPGKAIRQLNGKFVQPGDMSPPRIGDLNLDRLIDIRDWVALKASATASLVGTSDEVALTLGDLNLDRKHSINDVLLFRDYYEAEQGAGAFASIEHVPEPSTICLVAAAAAMLLAIRRPRRGARLCQLAALLVAGMPQSASARVTLFHEDFEGLTLGPNVDETLVNAHAWTQTPPAGWIVDDSGIPFNTSTTRGVTEWKGWSFADRAWWSSVDDQRRSEFSLGQGTVAVADPDEWDDKGSPVSGSPFGGYYNAFMTTPTISLAGTAPNAAKLTFASSWRPECCDDGPSDVNNQTATIRASYNGGSSFTDVLRWQSRTSDPGYKGDATNETVVLSLNNPAGASSLILQFGLGNAGNDWWWAVDNIEVFTPSVLEVNVDAGEMRILNAAGMSGYEITSPSSSLDHARWQTGNLDAQNIGPSVALGGDFNNDNAVDSADFRTWGNDFGEAGHDDFLLWQRQFGGSLAAGQSWETVISTDGQLLEFFLNGSSTFDANTIGQGYDYLQDARDLAFTYTTSDNLTVGGVVRYVNGGGATVTATSVPEPRSWWLLQGAACALAYCGRLWTSFPKTRPKRQSTRTRRAAVRRFAEDCPNPRG